ncbi:hypothetical protein [Hymenobacter glacieicola]|uniref:Uncharacterized protein n=1 Tax=Hymenobacter glacieicola TaxID=1562124 RepID=A0ABQ1X2Y5_9BACT|nr:hypothetical protein [Hymenobacter glacieicola]GGG57331.1 hypothetical protein GCM10011378_36790 [Hymenobacter glacieicola]
MLLSIMVDLLGTLKTFWHWLGSLLLDGLLADFFAWVAEWLFP